MTVHTIKTHCTYFQANRDGIKPFELRKNDRDYQVGDYLYSREYDPEMRDFTGRWQFWKITYTLTGETWLQPGYIAMTIQPVTNDEEYTRVFNIVFG